MILSVETSTRAFSVYVEENKMYADLEIKFSMAHSQGIVQTIEFMLKRVGKKKEDIEVIYAGLGPGSFTGIRVGLSFANTFSQALKIPLAGVSSLDMLSFETDGWKNAVIPFIRSRKDEVYTSFYCDEKRVDDYKILKVKEFFEYISIKRPKYLISSEEDYMDIINSYLGESGNQKDIDLIKSLKVIYSYPKAKIIPKIIKSVGIKPEMKYLRPLYIRSF